MDKRINRARKLLQQEKLDALLISSPYNIRFLTGFAGFHEYEREGYALLTQNNLYLLASSLQAEGARKTKGNFTVIELTAQKRLLATLEELIKQEEIEILGFEENLTYVEHKRFKKVKDIKFKLSNSIIEDARTIKDMEEITSLTKACKLTDDAFSYALSKLKEGVTENEIAWELEKHIREAGGELAFPSIVAFGENTAVPHHTTGDTKLTLGSVLLDFGAKVDGYCADMTRTVYFGTVPEEFKKMYSAVLEGQLKGFEFSKKLICEDIDRKARDYITSQGYPSIPHSVGHGVGLQVHELPHISPNTKDEILPNTAFTIEPGIYINGVGGIRIEDTVFFDGSEIIALTKSPKELIEI